MSQKTQKKLELVPSFEIPTYDRMETFNEEQSTSLEDRRGEWRKKRSLELWTPTIIPNEFLPREERERLENRIVTFFTKNNSRYAPGAKSVISNMIIFANSFTIMGSLEGGDTVEGEHFLVVAPIVFPAWIDLQSNKWNLRYGFQILTEEGREAYWFCSAIIRHIVESPRLKELDFKTDMKTLFAALG